MTFHEQSLALEARFRRASLLSILAVSSLAGITTLLLGTLQRWGPSDMIGLALLTSWTSALLVWARRRPEHTPAAGLLYFIGSSTSSIAALGMGLLYQGDATFGMGSYVPWLPFPYVAAFLVFRGRAAVVASSSVYIANLVVCGVYMTNATPTERALALSPLVQILLSHATYVTLFALLGRLLREHLVAIRAASLAAQDAFRDVLTDLPNRRQLTLWLSHHLTRGDRVAALLLDLDHFKDVNDRFGHAVGDAVLRGTANVLNASLPEEARLARWGGEEFMVLVPNVDGQEAVQVAENLRRSLASHAHPGVGVVTASFGVAVSQKSDTADSLFLRADEALYAVKNSGRGRVGLRR